LIDNEKDFSSPHGFDDFIGEIHGAGTLSHPNTITVGFISQKVADQSRCKFVKRIRKRSELDADCGKYSSTDSAFKTIVMRFRNL